MKVKSLSIKDFNQFKDFELDLTYPAGHPKAGLPLDKVCIIGQSGTGKTSLLNKLATKPRKAPLSVHAVDVISPLGFIDFEDTNLGISAKIYDNGYIGENFIKLTYQPPIMIEANAGSKDLGSNLEYWNDIIKEIVTFREQEIQKKLEIAELITTNQERLQEELANFNEWQKNMPNPLKDLADNFLDKILYKFNLRVRQSLDFKMTEDIETIKIETL